ncbi:hypothetical protein AAY81_02425 [Denitrobacterium detoxificans]|nr:hypothetical protein AAY81_02425 [Denitrobacterium detoxificans]
MLVREREKAPYALSGGLYTRELRVNGDIFAKMTVKFAQFAFWRPFGCFNACVWAKLAALL